MLDLSLRLTMSPWFFHRVEGSPPHALEVRSLLLRLNGYGLKLRFPTGRRFRREAHLSTAAQEAREAQGLPPRSVPKGARLLVESSDFGTAFYVPDGLPSLAELRQTLAFTVRRPPQPGRTPEEMPGGGVW